MKQLTEEQIEAVAKRTQDEWIGKGCPAGRMFRQAIREALALAADAEKTVIDCETCKYRGTSAADDPCCGCAMTREMKWEPKPARKTWPVGPFEAKPRIHSRACPVMVGDYCFATADNADNADAIAFALNMLPQCQAAIREAMACKADWGLTAKTCGDLLAEFDKWEMPEKP